MALLEKHINKLTHFNNRRRSWLFISAFVAVSILGIIFEWHRIESIYLLWFVGTSGLIVSITWWYWTMSLIRGLLEFKIEEAEILADIVNDIKDIKKNITSTS